MNDSAIALARNTDPATSHTAAAITKPNGERICREILASLRRNPAGLTSRALVIKTGLDFATITPRMKPMESAAFVTRGHKARTEFNRAPATVWLISPKGIEYLANKSTEPA